MNLNLAYHQDCISFLQKLVQTPSVNGQDCEEAIVKLIAEEAKKLGLPYQIIQKTIDRPNIFVGNAKSFAEKDSILLVAHTDTVAVGDLLEWRFPPFSAEIKENKI